MFGYGHMYMGRTYAEKTCCRYKKKKKPLSLGLKHTLYA